MDRSYFENYCGRGPYGEIWLEHSGVGECIALIDRMRAPVRSILVLGAATGEVLAHFDQAWGIAPHGCEVSRWAHARIPGRYRRRILRADMRHYVPSLARVGRRFDLIFANSLVYLEPAEVGPFIAQCSRVGRYFHFLCSTRESYESGDRHRRTLRPWKWWNREFRRNGFAGTRSRYLWRSLAPSSIPRA